ncbi:hypothetical protein [Halorussus salinus]|uniref:hypothetical protein n=1 Tax=Halorussus salinus TaxID=1364935 RepID=UPI00138F828D|nr:hypothetical protein [Halorussus salinus]HMB50807.1 hypothetical protein [Natronoarchaeum rubrum]
MPKLESGSDDADGCTTVEYSEQEKRELYTVTEEDISEMTDSQSFRDLLSTIIGK